MDIEEIWVRHNRAWSVNEIVACILLMISVLLVGLVLYKKKYFKSWTQVVGVELGVLYFFVVLESTVFGRRTLSRAWELRLFWSWKDVAVNHDMLSLQQIILNIILFVPIGFVLPLISNQRVKCWIAMLVGICGSLSVELLQLLLARGLFELDDIMHNTIGCVIGCLVSDGIFRIIEYKRKSQ